MATIAELITDTWPVTEKTILAATDPAEVVVGTDYFGYAAAKLRQIDRAKRTLYGEGTTVPSEDDIPEIARYWIADQAVVYLIKLAIDFYMVLYTRSDSKDEANFSYHDQIAALQDLREELEAGLLKDKDDVLDAIGSTEAPDAFESAPAVSTDRLIVNPVTRAFRRGPAL